MKNEAGLTLLEVLIAAAVLAVALASLLGLHSRNLRLVAQSQDMTMAAVMASRLAAHLRVPPQIESGSYSGDFSEDLEGLGLSAFAAADKSWRRDRKDPPTQDRFEWRMELSPTPVDGIRKATVEVGLKDEARGGLAELTFLLAPGG